MGLECLGKYLIIEKILWPHNDVYFIYWYCILLHIASEESIDLPKQSVGNNNQANVSTTDIHPVNDVSNQPTVLSVKPKYRSVHFWLFP